MFEKLRGAGENLLESMAMSISKDIKYVRSIFDVYVNYRLGIIGASKTGKELFSLHYGNMVYRPTSNANLGTASGSNRFGDYQIMTLVTPTNIYGNGSNNLYRFFGEGFISCTVQYSGRTPLYTYGGVPGASEVRIIGASGSNRKTVYNNLVQNDPTDTSTSSSAGVATLAQPALNAIVKLEPKLYLGKNATSEAIYIVNDHGTTIAIATTDTLILFGTYIKSYNMEAVQALDLFVDRYGFDVGPSSPLEQALNYLEIRQ